jgi:hypothetical protein
MATRSDMIDSAARRSGFGLFRRTFEMMMGARERQARRFVTAYLASLDAETLAGLGYEPEEIRRILRRQTAR